MPRVAVRILHVEPDEDTGELTRLVARARGIVAEHLASRFRAAGADDVQVVGGRPDGVAFGARLRRLVVGLDGGLVVLGSGSIPLASDEDVARLVGAAAGDAGGASVTNNRYSSDVLATPHARSLADVPADLPADNLLPRWLADRGVRVEPLTGSDRLGIDIDSPLDLELVRRHPACPVALAAVIAGAQRQLGPAGATLDRLAALARDPASELLVAGRLSARTLARLETGTACRVRALVEERGLRASGPLPGGNASRQRPPASLLGLLLDEAGPRALGSFLARLGDGALIDTRVLLAHRLGADERRWPPPEDRFASDLLLPDRIADPWLRSLTQAAVAGPLPVAFGGHTLIGPGLGLALGLSDAG